ncbi:MAG: DNA-processing protein DprA [Clostridiales bacterium]|jgi:DNA processing protein|nr:DNA-processing protein DprA [Clostridiales bacterium]
MTDVAFNYWLANAPGITGGLASTLSERYDAENLWNMDADALNALPELKPEQAAELLSAKNEDCILTAIEALEKRGIWLLGLNCAGYPELLSEIYNPPALLYCMGRIPPPALPRIAVIGSRRCSAYGLATTNKLVRGLAGVGFVIVSGMAGGIDAEAHKTALDAYSSPDVYSSETGPEYAPSPTIAVLGCGVDICYPASNTALYRRIVREGCVISEYPPGTLPTKFSFPQRNRIISGLSLGVLVVEAGERSGTSITVNTALSQGRDVFVVPGSVLSNLSVGTNSLIKDGAIPVTTHTDIVWALRRELGYSSAAIAAKTENETVDGAHNIMNETAPAPLTADETAIYRYISDEPVDAGTLIAATGLAAQDVMFLLTKLELARRVKSAPGQRYIRV